MSHKVIFINRNETQPVELTPLKNSNKDIFIQGMLEYDILGHV